MTQYPDWDLIERGIYRQAIYDICNLPITGDIGQALQIAYKACEDAAVAEENVKAWYAKHEQQIRQRFEQAHEHLAEREQREWEEDQLGEGVDPRYG